MIVGEGEIHIKYLYLILMKNNLGNHKYCKSLIKKGFVRINNEINTDIHYLVKNDDVIYVNEKKINTQPYYYYMLNKPKGYLSANRDKDHPCVFDLIDQREGYCLGRLDKDTTGLLILTNDKSLSKKLLLPSNHVEKIYLVKVDHILDENLIDKFYRGIIIDQDIICDSAILEIIDQYYCYVTIHEGKYHQIKKMFLSCGYKVIELKRICFFNIFLDENLKEGEYRSLNNFEINKLTGGI